MVIPSLLKKVGVDSVPQEMKSKVMRLIRMGEKYLRNIMGTEFNFNPKTF
jgi:hypothetical protein